MKYALCVGNNYVGTANELHGCVNDATDWVDLLSANGYTTELMIEATTDQVLNRLMDYVADLHWGERLVFTYSGHGTWVPDASGDETDQRDEAMYMADGSLLMDDDLNKVFGQIPIGRGVLVLSDSCFSGSVTRWASDLKWGSDMRPRFVSPAQFTNLLPSEVARVERATLSGSKDIGQASLISGCDDTEYSYDANFGGRGNGAFTRAAIDSYVPGQSLSAWFKAIRTRLPSTSYPQTPQLTAASLYRRYAKAL